VSNHDPYSDRSAEMRVLDVAIACGFKTQQHFARVFREMCGASPTEYRYGRFWREKPVPDIVETLSNS
jgi:AraC-like DNA-binding protein